MSFRMKPRRISRPPIPMLGVPSKRPFLQRVVIAARMLNLKVRDEPPLVVIPYYGRERHVAGAHQALAQVVDAVI